MTEEIKRGSVGISETSHQLLTSLVYDANSVEGDRPFLSIVEAFRFAFAYAYSQNITTQKSGKNVTVAPRQFVVDDYLELLRDEVLASGKSLGGLISEYAEAGCQKMDEVRTNGKSILSLME